ncbi:Uncharacterised protein [Raoultella ornithinolytica]|nr:Uncharacterised protein [Raoultella ornithinolytica]
MAISTNINYPADYLPCPLKGNFGLKPTSPLKSTQMVTGRRRQRRAYTSVPTQTPVSWIFTDGQAQLFEAWFRDTITDGADWFNMPLLTRLVHRITYVGLSIFTKVLHQKGENIGDFQRRWSSGRDRSSLLAGQSSRILL